MPAKEVPARRTAPWVLAGIFLATIAAYLPALRGGFIWDDDAHVTKPALRSLSGLGRIWTELGATQQYYPVLHSAFWLEHRLWADSAFAYHLANVLLHATAACLFAVLLRRLSVRGAALAGFVFALHPVCVESVAWISEQKNTLSAVFALLAAIVYLGWREGGGGGRAGRYLLAAGLFALAILTKSVTATLPAALLVLAWWRRGRLGWREDVAPLIPWLVLGASGGLLTAWVEWRYIGAHGNAFSLGLAGRCLLAGRALWFYLGKLAWPADLVFIYPRWTVSPGQAWQYAYPAAALALLGALAWVARRGRRGPLAAGLLFCGTLFPALGFFNVYPFVFSYVADHFQYLASLPVIAAAAWLAAGWGEGTGREWRTAAAAAVLVLLGGLTWRQCGAYRDVRTLYARTLEENPGCWLAHLNLGNMLFEEGRVGEALAHYEAAMAENPGYADTRFNLGRALLEEDRCAEAAEQFGAALRLDPGNAEAHDNLGVALARTGRTGEAVFQFREAVRLDPANRVAHYNLGTALGSLGRTEEAKAELDEAARLGLTPPPGAPGR